MEDQWNSDISQLRTYQLIPPVVKPTVSNTEGPYLTPHCNFDLPSISALIRFCYSYSTSAKKPFPWPTIWLTVSQPRDELMNRYTFSNVGCKVVFRSCRISNFTSIRCDKASVSCHLCSLILFLFAKLHNNFPLTPKIHAMPSHRIRWPWSLGWHVQRCQ